MDSSGLPLDNIGIHGGATNDPATAPTMPTGQGYAPQQQAYPPQAQQMNYGRQPGMAMAQAQPTAQPMAQPMAQPQLVTITVPQGFGPGNLMSVATGPGQPPMQVQVPQGVFAGQAFQVQLPTPQPQMFVQGL
jgi:hypothetical protein